MFLLPLSAQGGLAILHPMGRCDGEEKRFLVGPDGAGHLCRACQLFQVVIKSL
jgi:hypothetical protein